MGDKVTKKIMKRVAGRVELSERAVMIFHAVAVLDQFRMSDRGGGGVYVYVILLLMQTPRSGGPQGRPDSQLRGHWPPLPPPPPLEPPLLPCCLQIHTHKKIYL